MTSDTEGNASGVTTATLAPPKIAPPSPAAVLAAEALLVLDRIDPKVYGASCVEDLYAQCHTALGAARLAEGDLAAAEQELAEAYEHLEVGSGDILSRAQMLDFEAALRLAQRRYAEALTAIDRASRSFRTARDRHFEGLAQLRRAEILRAAGRRTDAIVTCRKGLALIDPDRALVEAKRARRSLVHDLAALGRHDEAEMEAARPPALPPEEA
jgi:tetratricopeptide (TPR) repeat protein